MSTFPPFPASPIFLGAVYPPIVIPAFLAEVVAVVASYKGPKVFSIPVCVVVAFLEKSFQNIRATLRVP